MNINQLRYFIKTADCGSMTDAAQALYISQPSLSKSIAQLESEYSIQLFERKPLGVVLTPVGVKFLNYAKVVVEAATRLDNTFTDRGAEDRSQLFIASQQCDFLYDILVKTFKKSGAIVSNILETDRKSVIRKVIEGEVDLGILVRSTSDSKTFLWQSDLKKLEVNHLDKAGVFACIGPKSPYYKREQITFAEAERCPQIALDMEQETKMANFIESTKHHFNMNNIIFFNSISACAHFLLETDSLLFVSKWAIGCFAGTPIRSVAVVSDNEEPAPVTELVWIKRYGEPLNKLSTRFINNLNDYFGLDG